MRYIRKDNKDPRTVKWRYADPSRHISTESSVTSHLIKTGTVRVAGSIAIFFKRRCTVMAQLMVRNLNKDLVKALKQRAAKHNRSAEQEHREILQAALRGPRRRSLAEVLAAIPNVGKDSDFQREQSDQRG